MPWSGGSGGAGTGTGGGTFFRKVTSKTVTNTVALTDLFNGEITITANAMGATGHLYWEAWGTYVNNTGGVQASPNFQLIFGPTTIFNVPLGQNTGASATVGNFRFEGSIMNLATNSQVCYMWFTIFAPGSFAAGQTNWSTGNGITVSRSTATPSDCEGFGHNTAAVDTTAGRALVLNVGLNVANANLTAVLLGAYVEIF